MSPKLINSLEYQEKCQYTPRHYAVTHIQCRDLKEAVTLRPDEALKRTYPSMWADTYYVDPFKVGINASMQSTTNSQINQTQVDSVPTGSRSEQEPPVEGAQVSSHTKVRSDATDTSPLSIQSNKNSITIPYVIFNLSSDACTSTFPKEL